MTTPLKTIDVKPKIPETLQSIQQLSENLWFVWNYEARDLFRRINPDLWEETRRNPVESLYSIKQRDLKNLARDEGFIAHMERVKGDFDRYMTAKPDPSIFGEGEAPFTAQRHASGTRRHTFGRSLEIGQ